MRRLLFAVLALAALAAAWFFFLESDSSPELSVPPGSTATASAAPEAPSPVVLSPASRAAQPGAVDAAPAGPPASFVAALGTVTGRVVDSEGAPLQDFPLDLIGGVVGALLPPQSTWLEEADVGFAYETYSTRTGTDGRFRIERVDPDGYYLFHLGAGTPRQKIDVCPGAPPAGGTLDVGDLKLPPHAVIIGRVVDAKGEPIPGARVRATQLPPELLQFGIHRVCAGSVIAFHVPGEPDWRAFDVPPIVSRFLGLIYEAETVSGADGAFRMEGVPLGQITVVADMPGLVDATRGPVSTVSGGEKSVGDVAMSAGEPLDGRVIDGDDKGVAGAPVLAGSVLSIFPVALLLPIGESGADGAFHAQGFTDAQHVVAARRKEACAWKMVDQVYAGVDEPEIRVDDTTTLTVRALDAAGVAVKGAKVVLQPKTEIEVFSLLQPPIKTSSRTVETDAGIEVRGVSRMKFNVFVRKDGYALAKAEADLSEGPTTIDVPMKPETPASVRVISATSKEPVEHALVLALTTVDEDEDAPFALPIAPLAAERTNAEGIATLRNVDDGKHTIRVVHPKYAVTDAQLVVPGPPLVIEVRGGGSLRGRVTKDGVPVGEPYVVFAMPKDERQILQVLPRLTVVNPIDSTFTFPRLPGGEYYLDSKPSFEDFATGLTGGPQQGMGGGGNLLFAPLFMGRSTTRVSSSDSGGDAGGDEAEGDEGGDEDGGEGKRSRRRGSGVEVKVHAGSQPPAESDDSGPFRYEAVVREEQETWIEIDVARLPGAIEKGRIAGVVRVNGTPRPELMVVAEHRGGAGTRTARTDGAGAFDLGEVPAGSIAMRVAQRAGSEEWADLWHQKIELAAAEAKRLDVAVEAGHVEGMVRAAIDSDPIAEARVILTREGGEDGEVTVLTGASGTDGKFSFPVVPAGEYTADVTRVGYAAARVRGVAVPIRGAPPRVDVRLVEAVKVSGRVELPPEAGAAEVLFVHFPSESEIDFTSFTFVDPKTMRFTAEGIAPGRREVRVYGAKQDLEPVQLEVPVSGLPDCLIAPKLAPPPKPQEPKGEKPGG